MNFNKISVGGPTPSSLVRRADVSDSIAFNAIIHGMLPKARFIPSADPDAPAPASESYFVHPRLPGLLFKKVSTLAELYQLGGNFAIGTKQGVVEATVAQGLFVALMGRRAKAALTGTPVHVHYSAHNPAMCGPIRNRTAGESVFGPYPALTEAGLTIPLNNGQITSMPGVSGATQASTFYSDAPDAVVPAPAEAVDNIQPGSLFVDLVKDGTAAQIGALTIMAIIGDYDDGALYTSSLNAVAPPVGLYLGCAIRRIPLGFVKTLCAQYRSAYVAGCPSIFREVAAEAYDRELKVVDPKEVFSVSFGVTWETAAAGITAFRRGYIVPRQDRVSTVTYIPYEDSARFGLPRYDVVLPTDLEDKLDSLSNSMTMGFWDFHNGSFRAPTAVPSFTANRGAPYSVAELVAARAASYALAFADSTIAGAASAAGTNSVVDGVSTPVPTLDTKFRTERPYLAFAGHDPHLYKPFRRMREFYRRVAKRTEDLARAM